jgi:hypothetical protein
MPRPKPKELWRRKDRTTIIQIREVAPGQIPAWPSYGDFRFEVVVGRNPGYVGVRGFKGFENSFEPLPSGPGSLEERLRMEG